MVQNNLKQLLDERGKSLYWLSKETSIGYWRLATHYKDMASMIRYETLEKICEALSCRIQDILILEKKQTD